MRGHVQEKIILYSFQSNDESIFSYNKIYLFQFFTSEPHREASKLSSNGSCKNDQNHSIVGFGICLTMNDINKLISVNPIT